MCILGKLSILFFYFRLYFILNSITFSLYFFMPYNNLISLFYYTMYIVYVCVCVCVYKTKVVLHNISPCLTRANNFQFNLRLMARLIADASVVVKFTVVRILNDMVCRLCERLVREMYTALPNVASCQTSFWRKRRKVAKLDL